METHHQGEYWLLADAKNRFSEVARISLSKGPQKILRRGGNLVVLSEEEYLKLTGEHLDFKNFLLKETLDMTDLDLTRDESFMRDFPV